MGKKVKSTQEYDEFGIPIRQQSSEGVGQEAAYDDFGIPIKKKVDGGASSTTGSVQSQASDYKQLVGQLNNMVSSYEEDLMNAFAVEDKIKQIDPNSLHDDNAILEYQNMIKAYNEYATQANEKSKQIKSLQELTASERGKYQEWNKERQDKLFSTLGLNNEQIQGIKNELFKQQNPDRAAEVDQGTLIPQDIDVDADDLAKVISGSSFDSLMARELIRKNRDISDRIFGSFTNSVVKTLGFELPASAGATISNLLSDLKIKDSDLEKSWLRPGIKNQIKKAIALIPGAQETINDVVDNARVASFMWAKEWRESPVNVVPVGPGAIVPIYNDPNLIQSISQIKEPLDAIDFVFASIGQGAAQIIPSVLSRGTTSYVQEVGHNYLEGVAAIAEKEGLTPQEVIRSDKDEPIIARQFGIVQGALDALGAGKVVNSIGKTAFTKDLKKRALNWLEAGKAAGTELVTESTQSALQQTAVGKMTGLGNIDAVKSINWLQAIDEGIAGAIGGGAINVGGQSFNALSKIDFLNRLKKNKDKTPDQQEAYDNFMDNVADVAKKYGDPRPKEEIVKFVEEEVLPKVEEVEGMPSPDADKPGYFIGEEEVTKDVIEQRIKDKDFEGITIKNDPELEQQLTSEFEKTKQPEAEQPTEEPVQPVETTEDVTDKPATKVVGAVKRKKLSVRNKYDEIPDSTPNVVLMKFFANGGKVNQEEAINRSGLPAKDLFGKVAKKGVSYNDLYEYVKEATNNEDITQDEVDAIIDDFLDGKTRAKDELEKLFDGAAEESWNKKIEGEYNNILETKGKDAAEKWLNDQSVKSVIDEVVAAFPEEIADQVIESSPEVIEDTLSDTERSALDKVLDHYTENGEINWSRVIDDIESGFEPQILDLPQNEYEQLKTKAREAVGKESRPATESEPRSVPPPVESKTEGKQVTTPAEDIISEKQKKVRELQSEFEKLSKSLNKNLTANQQDMFGRNKTQSMFDDRKQQQDIVNEKKKELERAQEDLQKTKEAEQRKAETKNQLEIETKPAKKSEKIQNEIDDLFDQLGKTLGSTLSAGINPEAAAIATRIAAKYVELGVVKFGEMLQDVYARYGEDKLREYFDALKAGYGGILATAENTDDMTPLQEVRAAKIDEFIKQQSDDTGATRSLESDRGRNEADQQMGQENVPTQQRPGDKGTGKRTKTATDEGVQPGSDTGVPYRIPTPDSEQTDTGLDKLEEPESIDDRPGRGADNTGSGATYGPGVLFAKPRAEEPLEATGGEGTIGFNIKELASIQAKADKSAKVIVGDLENIKQTVPILMPHQHENVLKAERRFFDPNPSGPNKGILFTDGTGTGKTFTGLGIIKRMVQQGKGNVLIVAPQDSMVKTWISQGKHFNLDITQLENKKDAGKGIVITTYANFKDNDALLERAMKQPFDAVLYDESHYLIANQDKDETVGSIRHKQITYAPDVAKAIVKARYESQMKNDMNKFGSVSKETRERIQSETKKLVDQTKVVFLSATPFSYHFNLTYADGYLFTIRQGEEDPGMSYRNFYISNFGYRIRYGKLNIPESGVDVGLMERMFHKRLMEQGAVSSTRLRLDKDYSREFVLIDDKLGFDIDEGFKVATDYRAHGWKFVNQIAYKKMDWLRTNRLLEAMKARHAIKRIKEHRKLGRKIVVFHGFKDNIPEHPFDFSNPELWPAGADPILVQEEIERFHRQFPQYRNLDLSQLKNPIRTFIEEFGDDVMIFNGSIDKKIRRKAIEDFNTDGNGKDILLVQTAAGKEGISLHDITNVHQRVMMNLGLPLKPTDAIQTEGRIYRIGLKSDAIIEYPVVHTNFEKVAFTSTISGRTKTAENLAFGMEARALDVSFKEGYKNPVADAPNENQGKGGRDGDFQLIEIDPFEESKTFYFSRQKRTSKTKSLEGTDYYATPEPLGFKMVEWLGAKSNESLLEPSAGHGAIARFFPEFTKNKFIEPSYDLRGTLSMSISGEIIDNVFEEYYIGNKHDGIAMNPPYGSSSKTAYEHTIKALNHLKDGGRVISIVPDGPSMQKRMDEFWESDESQNFHLMAEISLPGVTFERAGTKVKTKILVIDKYTDEKVRESLPSTQMIDLSGYDNINDFFDAIKDLSIRERVPIQKSVEENLETGFSKMEERSGENSKAEVVEGKHTKNNYDIWTVKMNDRVERDQWDAYNQKAKAYGGRWSSYRGHGATVGWVFRNKQSAHDLLKYIHDGKEAGPVNDSEGLGDSLAMMDSSKGRIPMSGFESLPLNGEGIPFKFYQKAIELHKKYNPDATLGQGRTASGQFGTFYLGSKNVRIKGLNSLSVVLHELVHALDSRNKVISNFIENTTPGNPIRKKLSELYIKHYPDAKPTDNVYRRMVEGYATLIERYIATPTDIKRNFPELVDAFIKTGGPYHFPQMSEFLNDAETIIKQYQRLDPLAKMSTRIVSETVEDIEKKKDVLGKPAEFTRVLFDALYPYERMANLTGKQFTTDDASLYIRMSNNALQMAEKNVSGSKEQFYGLDADGNFVKKHDFNFRTIVEMLDKRKLKDEFAAYLYARRIKYEFDELHDIEEELEKVQSAEYLDEIMDKLKIDNVEEALKVVQVKIDQLSTQMLQMEELLEREGVSEQEAVEAFKAGSEIFSKEEEMFDALTKENLLFAVNKNVQMIDRDTFSKLSSRKGYAPLKRLFFDELIADKDFMRNVEVPIIKSTGKTRASQFMARRGSEKPVINPLYSAMAAHAEMLRKGMKQMAANKLLAMVEKHQEEFAPLIQIEKLKTTGDPKNRFPQEKDENVIMARKDYKRVPILMDAKLKAVWDENYAYQNPHAIERIGISMAQVFRAGTTGLFWQFFANNIVLDQIIASVNTRTGMMPFVTSSIEMFKALAIKGSLESAYLKEYMFLAGTSQTFLSADINSTKTVNDILFNQKKSFAQRVSDMFSFIAKMMSIPGNASEIFTRATEYIRARKAGRDQVIALEQAGRVSAPFHHVGQLGGRVGRSYVRSLPYFNAALQVLIQNRNALNTKEGRIRFAFAALSIMSASVASTLYLLGLDDEDERKQLIKSIPPESMSKYIFAPNPFSSKRLLQIRVPDQLAFMSSMMNMMLIEQADQTSYKWHEYGEASMAFLPTQLNPFAGYQAIFSYVPQALKPTIETGLGVKTYPSIRPIETQRDKSLPAELRYNRFTAPGAVILGDVLGWSPKKIQHFVYGTGGRTMRYVLDPKKIYNLDNLFIRELYFEASRQVQFYYDTKKINEQNMKAWLDGLKEYSDEEINRMETIADYVAEIDGLLDEYGEYDMENDDKNMAITRNAVFQKIRELEKIVYF